MSAAATPILANRMVKMTPGNSLSSSAVEELLLFVLVVVVGLLNVSVAGVVVDAEGGVASAAAGVASLSDVNHEGDSDMFGLGVCVCVAK